MALNFTISADLTSFLNFNKCANLCIVADFTTIKISEVINSNAYTKLDIRSNFCIHSCLHLCLPASPPKAAQPAEVGQLCVRLGGLPRTSVPQFELSQS